MKQLFCTAALSLLLFYLTSAQVPVKNGKGFYEVIDSTVAGSKQELQVKAKMWMANAFKDAKEVIQLDDKEAGEVLGKGNVVLGYMYGRCKFTIKISTRDNKYRCQIYDMAIYGTNGQFGNTIDHYIEHPKGLGSRKILEKTDEEMRKILAELAEAMKKGGDNF